MKIDSATIRWVFPPPFAEPVSDSTLGPFTMFPIGILELRSEGLSGFGMVPVGRAAADIAESIFLPALWTFTLDGPGSVERFWIKSCQRIRNLGPGITLMTLSGIEMALWDLAAKKVNQTLTSLLGSDKRAIPAYGSNGWVNYDLKKLVETVETLVSRGFRLVKVKVGLNGGSAIDEDVHRIRELRKAVGDTIQIAVDANQCWTVPEALSFANKVADQRIDWFEEPIAAQDFCGYSSLAKTCPIPLAAGESLSHAYSMETLLRLEGVAILQPVFHVLGGVTGYLRAAAIAADFGVPVVSGGFSQFACNLVAVARSGLMTEYLTPFMDTFQTIWQETPRLSDGFFKLSDRPGHGLEPDREFCRKYQRGDVLTFGPNDCPPLHAY